jgi:methyl-accepting chemotaxis protein
MEVALQWFLNLKVGTKLIHGRRGGILSRLITKPLFEAVSAANKIADGDMTVDLTSHSRDEVGQLIDALKNMVEHIIPDIKCIFSTDELAAVQSTVSQN